MLANSKEPNVLCSRCGHKWYSKAIYHATCSQCKKNMKLFKMIKNKTRR